MLVMSRKQGESIELSELGVVVKVISLKRSKVQLGVDAPPQITVNRSEIAADRKKSAGDGNGPFPDGLADQHLLEHLAHIEGELAALAELADPKDRLLAQQLASDSIQRLAGIRRTLRFAARRGNEAQLGSEAQPIANFVRVRSDVLECLRDDQEDEAESEHSLELKASEDQQTSCVRQSHSSYAIMPASPARSCVA
jgi:carbon storage regulator CsrA